ncbi:4-alpha-glucanotransferase [Limibacter armeniacum]|uniref:4-alpha-glucanotransferase n=1 Tax=Limibacter armeniacum TaxID=466084 RepID=UPI002FE54472
MIIRFKINYHTQWGQRLYVAGSIAKLGKFNEEDALAMQTIPNGDWEVAVDLKGSRAKEIRYKYFLKDEHNNALFWEHGEERVIGLDNSFEQVSLEDTWRSKKDALNVYDSSAFTKAIFHTEDGVAKKTKSANQKANSLYAFRVKVPRIAEGYEVRLMGSTAELGNWKPEKAAVLSHVSGTSDWETEVSFGSGVTHVNYKFVIVEKKSGKAADIESGNDRYLYVEPETNDKKLYAISGGFFRYSSHNWKGAGVAIPVFSLRSKAGLGVGEFTDIKPLVDWSKKIGLKMVQILPVNDTMATHTWVDSYPYAAVSVYALHPLYLNVEQAGTLKSKKEMTALAKKKAELNELDEIDYEAVMLEKLKYMRALWAEQKDAFYKDKKVQAFVKEHENWLKPYAAFSYLREKNGTPDYNQWKTHSKFVRKNIYALFEPKSDARDEVYFYVFMQYHLHLQLLEAAEYARANKVVLKGDIPIGIYRYSADAWSEPRLYNMDGQAGAPPDDFAVNGQNWGFPTYNWEEMQKDGYQWWVSRLHHLSQYFEAFRIDHILGFFRIWEIPLHSVQGLLGQFRPALPIHIQEFSDRGIHFNYERYCKPYIREHFLGEVFGENAVYAKETFLEEYAPGEYKFKEQFDSQLKIQQYFNDQTGKSVEDAAKDEKLRDALYSLHNEVLFMEALGYEDGEHFAPRVTMDKSRTYSELSDHERGVFWDLYIDYFFRRQEGLWRDQAMQKLPAIKEATEMLICGEDLGMVPDCVPGVMQELDILSLEIQRMPKDINQEFGHPAYYPYMSVGSTSTHDMATIRGWWEEDPQTAQEFYNHMLGHWGASPFFCEPWVAKDIINQHMYSPSMWAVFPIQDLLAIDGELRREDARIEQINVPAIKHHYWRYRFHIPMEDMIKKAAFNKELGEMLKRSGRNTPF